jgi:hypothetical protein
MSVLKQYNPATSQWEAVVLGKQGPSGTVAVNAPLTNSGTSTAAQLGIDYSALQYGQNVIINGGFDHWQRGTSFNATDTTSYGAADRFMYWHNGSPAGTNTVSRQTHTPGQTLVPGNPTYFQRWTHTTLGTNQTVSDIVTKIENVSTFAGQTVTLSFYSASSTAGKSIDLYVTQNFGSGGSTLVDTAITGIATLGTTFARYTTTFTVPSISGKTIGTGDFLLIRLRLGSPVGGMTWDLSNIQLEAGSQATPFKRAGGTLQGELAACQRYYYRFGGNEIYQRFGYGVFVNSTTANTVIHHPVTLRANPTSIEYSTLAVYDGGSVFTATGIGLVAFGRNSISMEAYISSGGTQYRPVQLITNNSLNGYIAVNAEL